MISCFDDDDNLSDETFLSTRQNNWWRQASRSSFKSREEKLWIVMIKADRRIARKACKWKSTYISFRKWKVMNSKTTFFDRCKNNLDINDCNKWSFWLFFSLLVFEEKIELSTITFFVIQNDLISKYHFSIYLIAFRNSNIIFKIFVLIFFIKNFDILRLNSWFNFIRIVEKFYIQWSTITFSIAKKIDAFIVVEKRQSKLNNFALNSTERYDDETRSL